MGNDPIWSLGVRSQACLVSTLKKMIMLVDEVAGREAVQQILGKDPDRAR